VAPDTIYEGEETSGEREQLRCPSCGSSNIVFDSIHGEHVCRDCGNVIETVIDQGPEWRAFTPEQKARRTRVGAPLTPLRPDGGLSTMIDWRNVDSEGRQLDLQSRLQVSRLRKVNKMFNVGGFNEKNLRAAINEIERVSTCIGLPRSVREEAAILYRKATRSRLIKGRSVESMVAACIYAACKLNNLPRTLDEISDISKASRKDISRSYRLLINYGILSKVPPSRAMDFVPRIVSDLKLSMKVQRISMKVLNYAYSMGITSGKMPEGLAAASIYLTSLLLGEKRTQREVATVASVTEVTIRNRFKELLLALDFEVLI